MHDSIRVEHFGPNTGGGLRLLDIGCSSGIIAHFLSDWFGQVVGVDIDEEALRFARTTTTGRISASAYRIVSALPARMSPLSG